VVLRHPFGVGAQGALLARADRHVGVAVAPVAVDTVAGDAFLQHAQAVAGKVEQQPCIGRTQPRLQYLQVAAVAGQRLPAVAAGGAPADARGLQYRHPVALFGQRQRGGQPGVAGAEHRHVGAGCALQRCAWRRWRQAGRVPAGRMIGPGGGVGHARSVAAVLLPKRHRGGSVPAQSSCPASPRPPCRRLPRKRNGTVMKPRPRNRKTVPAVQEGSALLRWLKERNITEVECLVPDITGNARGKIIPADKFRHDYGTRLPEGIFATTVTGDYPDDYYELTSPSDSDMLLRPDPDTVRMVPWATDPTAQIIHDCYTKDGHPHELAPRNVLRKVLAEYEKEGLRPVVAPELEFFLVQKNT